MFSFCLSLGEVPDIHRIDGRSKGACVTNTARHSVESEQPAQFPHPRTAHSHLRVRRDAGARFYGGLGGGNAVERSDKVVRRSSGLHEQGKRHLQVPRFRGPPRFRVGWPAFPSRLKGNALLRATKADCRASRVALCGVSVRAYSIHMISLTLSCSKPDMPNVEYPGNLVLLIERGDSETTVDTAKRPSSDMLEESNYSIYPEASNEPAMRLVDCANKILNGEKDKTPEHVAKRKSWERQANI